MKRIAYILILLMLVSCDQKELCFDHDMHESDKVTLTIEYNRQWQFTVPGAINWRDAWSDYDFGMAYDDLIPHASEGLRVVVYDDDRQQKQVNIPQWGGEIVMIGDDSSLLIYSNDTEYIVFDDMEDLDSATASTRSVIRSTYKGFDFINKQLRTVNPPDMLYGAVIEDLDDMESRHLKVTMQPLVYTYLIRYKFTHGLNYVAIARGALGGMAIDVRFDNYTASDEAGVILYDCELKDWGVQAIVRSFGAPLGGLVPNIFGLNLEVRLKNGTILDFNYDITDQMALQPRGGVIQVDGIEISDEIGKENGGEFDVSIHGWDEFIDIPVVVDN